MKTTQALRPFFILTIAFVLVAGELLFLQASAYPVQAVTDNLFVAPAGTGTDCSQAAPCSLSTALAIAQTGDAIYLAGGTYTGSGNSVVMLTIELTLYGGWDGSTGQPPVRNPAVYESILDGQNQRRVVTIDGTISPKLTGLTITGGNAADVSLFPGRGGGIFSQHASPIIEQNTIISNAGSVTPTAVNGSGGGIFLKDASSAPSISKNQIMSNAAGLNGAGGGIYLQASDAAVTDNLIQGNTSQRNGAGIFSINSSPVVRNNSIVGNIAGAVWHGGGVNCDYGSPTIDANFILSNTAGSSGGIGMETGEYFTVTNNVIANNIPEGIRLWELTRFGLIAQNTIANHQSGSGIYLPYPNITPTIVSNIVVSNSFGIFANSGASGTLDYNNVWGNSHDNWLPGALQPGPHSLQVDPQFVDAASHDFHLLPGSPCIDAGIDFGVSFDKDGNPRPVFLGFDLGAFEFQGLQTFLPLVRR